MINKIMDSITNTLYNHFGYETYINSIKQDFEEPCFFITCLNPSEEQALKDRYLRKNQFDIQYFPKEKSVYSVQEELFDLMEYLDVEGSKIRGTKMHGEVVDGALHFFVNYDVYIIKERKEELMAEIKTNIIVE